MGNEFFDAYKKLRKDVIAFHDAFIKKFKKTNCKKGCSDCCEEISVVPLEFHYLKNEIEGSDIRIEKGLGRCPFLKDNLCQIYELRPLMCITQGLPLIMPDEETGVKEISICDKNLSLFDNCRDKLIAFEYDRMLILLLTYNIAYCNSLEISLEKIPVSSLI